MFKYTVRLILFDQANDRGWLPIYIRITIGGKMSHIATGHFIHPKSWDKKNERIKDSDPAAKDLNSDITTRKQTVVKKIVDYQVKGQSVTAAQVKQAFVGGNQHNIFEFCESFIKEVQHKRRSGTLANYQKHLKVVELYHGSRSLTFEQITHEWLVGFEDHLRKKVGGNYIYIIWKTLKTFFNAAKKRGIISHYPFHTFENPEYKAPVKDYLTIDDIDKLEAICESSNNKLVKQTCVYFLLGCYSGLRISDWFRFNQDKHVREGRLFLRASKNQQDITMPITGRLKKHLNRTRLMPLTISEQEMNRTLKNLFPGRKITTHCARHSFAITMCCEQGIGAEVTAELMGITLKTCVDNYYRVTNRRIDKDTIKAWGSL